MAVIEKSNYVTGYIGCQLSNFQPNWSVLLDLSVSASVGPLAFRVPPVKGVVAGLRP
jgi:hypothetical protein